MDAVPSGGEIRLEEMAEVLKKTEADEKLEQEYTRGQAAEIRGAMAEEESIVRELLNFEQPVTADNLMAAGLLMKERGKAAGRLYELAEETGEQGKLEEALAGLYESMTDGDSMKEAYR